MRLSRWLPVVLLTACVTPKVEAPKPVAPAPPPVVAPPKVEVPPSPYLRPDIVALRDEAKSLLRQQGDLFWRSWAFGESVDVSATYAGHETLFSAPMVKRLRDARTAATGDEAKALEAFELYVAGEVIARETEAASDAVSNALADATLGTPGAPRFTRLDELMAGEASAEQRARLQTAGTAVLNRVAPLVDARDKAVDAAAKNLGYPSAAEFGARLRGTSLEALAILAESTLSATQDLYVKAMDRAALEEIGLPLAKLRRSDLPRVFRRQNFDAMFPWERSLPAAQALFTGIGFDPAKEPGLRLDVGPFEKKSRRAICVPVDVPGDLRISAKPLAGTEALRELVLALAQGLEGTRNKRTEWEFQSLGGRAKSEALAIAFQDIVSSPAWLKTQADVKEPIRTSLAQRHAVERLYLVRRAAGLVLFGALQGQGRLGEPANDAYRRIMSRALGLKLTADDAKRLVLDSDPFLDNADYLFGWVLAAQVSRHLASAHGESWWTSRQSGEELAALWARGTAVTPLDVARWAGGSEVDPATMVEMLGAVPGVR